MKHNEENQSEFRKFRNDQLNANLEDLKGKIITGLLPCTSMCITIEGADGWTNPIYVFDRDMQLTIINTLIT